MKKSNTEFVNLVFLGNEQEQNLFPGDGRLFPLELLHTYQLGIVRYMTEETMMLLGENSGLQAIVEGLDPTALPFRMNGLEMSKVKEMH